MLVTLFKLIKISISIVCLRLQVEGEGERREREREREGGREIERLVFKCDPIPFRQEPVLRSQAD